MNKDDKIKRAVKFYEEILERAEKEVPPVKGCAWVHSRGLHEDALELVLLQGRCLLELAKEALTTERPDESYIPMPPCMNEELDIPACARQKPIAVEALKAKLMDEVHKNIANHYDQDGYGRNAWKDLALEMAEVSKQALAEYEKIRGEG